MLPLRDDLPTRRFPVVTVVFIAVNVTIFLLELLIGAADSRALDAFLTSWGVIPRELTHEFGPHAVLTLFTSMFLHGGVMHVIGNMLYLWIFGNNVEDVMGRWQFVLFYFLCGILASLAQVFAGPAVDIPSIGASGAIAGVLGAYMVLFPHARVATLVFLGYFGRVVSLPAVLVLVLWFLLQLMNGVLALSAFQSGGVAWFAHIGGFVAGLVLVWAFARRPRRMPPQPLAW